jgi:protein-disulfide isomerase
MPTQGLAMKRFHDQRRRLAAGLLTATALAAVLIGASQFSAGDADPSQPARAFSPEPAGASNPSLLAGIQQQGTALGSPTAPVTLVEYADLQCPYCAEWAREALPTLIADYVRTGKLRIVFHGMAFIGPDSDKALRTALAAGHDDHLWDVVHGLYKNQGAENAGWVTDELVTAIASRTPGLDAEKLLDARWENGVESELARAATAAQAAGVGGTPAFEISATGGRLRLLEITSLGPEGIVPAIEEVLAR